ncbi:tetratricopeptide repeat domain containing protein [Babesia gibsoni]|uniref:Tetratricopeptide repeat domain containing protein n=1 Tax=Babesia gibsoni TaxID=33632 RepID=A0AAD8LML5_BABGI|nr:tetratricopeptide repeat domain containing protein [Babesia gibsoni]
MLTPEELERKAKKNVRSFLQLIFGKDDEEAQELYNQAGNLYKQQKRWSDAVRCYMSAAKIAEKDNEPIFAASNLVEAANAMLKDDPHTMEHLDPLLQAANLYSSQGRFSQSGRILKNAAESFEERGDHKRAIELYSKSAEFYDLDEFGKVACSQIRLKYADLVSQYSDKYTEAIKIYETEAYKNLKNQLLRYGTKDIFIKSGLLHIVTGDATDAQIAFDKYSAADPKFPSSREGRFLKSLIDACEAEDAAGFQHAVEEFDGISKLDPWKVHILVKVSYV